MSLEGQYAPSPSSAVAEQVELYERTGGREGGMMLGKPVIILTTRGAKTGKIRKTPLMRVTDGTRYAVVASKGGAPANPVWYHNILAEPRVRLQDGPQPRDFTAHLAGGEERRQWWERAVAAFPDYATYQAGTDREIPLFVLEPVES